MSDILILYWEPGSGGDFIQSLLLNDSTRYAGVITQFTSNSLGREVPLINPQFKEMFNHLTNQWYCREWTNNDCVVLLDAIKNHTAKTFVIPTHRIDQVWFLKEQFFNSTTVGITYPKNVFPIVLKNWCKKVAQHDVCLDKIYDQPIHQHLKKNKVFGEFVLREQLRFGYNIRPFVDDCFDMEISLEDLYIANATMLESLVDDLSVVSSKMQQWLSFQSLIPQGYCEVNPILKNSLGYNSKATTVNKLDPALDLYDNILIKEFCLSNTLINNVPTFKTLGEADCFFNNIKNI
jgi:hypothetical protein